MNLYVKTIKTPVSKVTVICTDNHIINLSFENDNSNDFLMNRFRGYEIKKENELCLRCEQELNAYFEGKLFKFTVPVKFICGTEYEQKIWNALTLIPYGKTVNYAQIAVYAGVKGARAAGNALAKNPVAIIIPCHRVIKADGTLGGFCGGMQMSHVKESLLSLEKKYAALIH